MIYSTLGIHPHESDNMTGEVRNKITKLSSNKKVIGIGETGLDYYYENSNRENQTKSFITHIEIAQELNLPLVIHMRNAESEMIEIIEKYVKKKRIFLGSYIALQDPQNLCKSYCHIIFYFQ